MNQFEERTLALAGIVQAALIVQSLARTGTVDEKPFNASLRSVLVMDAVNTPAVFGGVEGVHSGLGGLANSVLRSADFQAVEVARYVMSMIHLQVQLFKDKQALQAFSTDVARLSAVAEDELISACSSVYRDHISPLKPQIMVQGEEGYLQRDGMADKVRAALLAGLRAAVLWEQKGGGRFALLFKRGQYQQTAQNLLRKS